MIICVGLVSLGVVPYESIKTAISGILSGLPGIRPLRMRSNPRKASDPCYGIPAFICISVLPQDIEVQREHTTAKKSHHESDNSKNSF